MADAGKVRGRETSPLRERRPAAAPASQRKATEPARRPPSADRVERSADAEEPQRPSASRQRHLNALGAAWGDSEPASPTLRTGTYNVAGGAEDFEENFGREGVDGDFHTEGETSDFVANQLVTGEVDVLSLQEVSAGRNDDPDFNQEILEDVFTQSLPEDFEDAHIDRYSVGPDGQPIVDGQGNPQYLPDQYSTIGYTATNEQGEEISATITRESVDASGNPAVDAQGRPIYEPSAQTTRPRVGTQQTYPVSVYQLNLEGGETYTAVYGDSGDSTQNGSSPDRHYGNTVLLGPGQQLERNPNTGALQDGAVHYRVLGRDVEDGEPRSAVGVTFTTPSGEQASAVSAHLTNSGGDGGEHGTFSRSSQMRELGRFVDDIGGPVIVGGDYNYEFGSEHLPSPEDVGLNYPGDQVDGIDHVLVTPGLEHGETTTVDGQGSDHEHLVLTEVTL